jgi:hypothetical protein
MGKGNLVLSKRRNAVAKRPPPDPGKAKRRPTARRAAHRTSNGNTDTPTAITPASIVKDYPHASRLSVADGRRAVGVIVDTRQHVPGRRTPPSPSFAFDVEHRYIGKFPDRGAAMAAIHARDEHARQHGAGNLAPQPIPLNDRARVAERDWRRKLKPKERRAIPAPVDRSAPGGKVRVRQLSAEKVKAVFRSGRAR